jgi:hypothetical protein
MPSGFKGINPSEELSVCPASIIMQPITQSERAKEVRIGKFFMVLAV